jgi:hypothetical protein
LADRAEHQRMVFGDDDAPTHLPKRLVIGRGD